MVKKWLFIILFAITSVASGQVFVRTNDVLSLSPTANPMQWTSGYPIRYTTYLRQGSIPVDLNGTYALWLISDRRDGTVIASNVMTTVSATNGCVTKQIDSIMYDPGDFYRSTVNIYSLAGVFQYTAAIDNVKLYSPTINFGITDADAYRGDWGNYVSNKTDLAYTIATQAEVIAQSIVQTGQVDSITGTSTVNGAITFAGNGVTQTGNVFNFSGVDNLGNHTATTTLNMAQFSITNISTNGLVFADGTTLSPSKLNDYATNGSWNAQIVAVSNYAYAVALSNSVNGVLTNFILQSINSSSNYLAYSNSVDGKKGYLTYVVTNGGTGGTGGTVIVTGITNGQYDVALFFTNITVPTATLSNNPVTFNQMNNAVISVGLTATNALTVANGVGVSATNNASGLISVGAVATTAQTVAYGVGVMATNNASGIISVGLVASNAYPSSNPSNFISTNSTMLYVQSNATTGTQVVNYNTATNLIATLAGTGNITFDDIKIIGAGTNSSDGFGFSTMELVPDSNRYSSAQYLVIDPTSPSHIHIRAGGTPDDSIAQLLLGGEKANVMVNNQSNNQYITVGVTSTNNVSYTWTFDQEASILPPVTYVTRGDTASGSIYGHTLKLGTTSTESIITTPAGTAGGNSPRLVINPGEGDGGGEGGDIYLWAGRGGSGGGSGGDIKIRGGYGSTSGDGGYIRIEGGDTSAGTGGQIEIKAGDSGTGNAGYVLIQGGSGNANANNKYVNIRTVNDVGANQDWYFTTNGNIVLPAGGLIMYSDNSLYSITEADPIFTNWVTTNTTYLLRSGGTMLGNINMGGFSITNIATNSIAFSDGTALNSDKVKEISRISARTEFTNRILIVGGGTNKISTNYPYYVYLLTNNETFSLSDLYTNTSRGEISVYFWATNNTISFDSTVSTAGLDVITFSNDRPTLVNFKRPPFATNWYAFQSVSFPEPIIGNFEIIPAAGGGTGLLEGLVFYAPFENSTAIDTTGNQTLLGSNSVSYKSGIVGDCIDMESNGFVVYTNCTDVTKTIFTPQSSTGGISVSFWTKWVNAGDVNVVFDSNLAGTWSPGNDSTQLYYMQSEGTNSGAFGFQFYPAPDENGLFAVDNLALFYDIQASNSWQHWVMTYDVGNNAFLEYHNGDLIKSNNMSSLRWTWWTDTGAGSFILGAHNEYSGWDFLGDLDEFAAWNRVLTTNEISELYNSGAGKSIP